MLSMLLTISSSGCGIAYFHAICVLSSGHLTPPYQVNLMPWARAPVCICKWHPILLSLLAVPAFAQPADGACPCFTAITGLMYVAAQET